MSDVLIVGSLNLDMTAVCDWLPRPGETITGHDFAMTGGGKGMNQAVAAARLGAVVRFCGAIGDDSNGELLRSWAQADGVDCTDLHTVANCPSGAAMIWVDRAGENSIVVIPGSNGQVRSDWAEQAIDRDGDAQRRVLSMCLEIPMQVVESAATAAAQAGYQVVLNPSPLQVLSDELLDACSVVVLNEHEAADLTDMTWDDQHLQQMQAFFAQHQVDAVITVGAAGAVVLPLDSEPVRVPGVQVTAVDTTGCGDAFTGALIAQLSQGVALAEAAGYAVKVGAWAATGRGAQASYPTAEQIADWRV